MNTTKSLLAAGVRVRAWRHFLGRFDPAARLTLHPGARIQGEGIVLDLPARAPSSEELALLDADGLPGTPTVEVFTTPAVLRERFAAVDPEEIGEPHVPPSKWYAAFTEEVSAWLTHVQAPVVGSYGLVLEVRDPDQPPPLATAGCTRALLGMPATLAGGEGPGPGASLSAAAVAHVNLGDGPAALAFWNVPLFTMAHLLRVTGGTVPLDLRSLLLRFVEQYPGAPVVRLSLLPGEGAFLPVQGIAHDLDATGADDLVITLTALPTLLGSSAPSRPSFGRHGVPGGRMSPTGLEALPCD